MPFTSDSHGGILHNYAPRLVAFEYVHDRSTQGTNSAASNFILFVGGLCDAFLTVRYPSVLATVLPASWALVEVQTRSSGVGFATGSLERDSEDLAEAVAYFRGEAKKRNADSASKIILFGHSTGSQDAIHYLVGPWKMSPMPEETKARPPLDGVILQAGISDREGVTGELSEQQIQHSLQVARDMVEQGLGRDHMPKEATTGMFGAQTSAERWLSLMSEDGDDDYFSSDLSDKRLERVWGSGGLAARGVKALILLSAEDENMPKHVNKTQLMAKWETYVKGSNGLWDDRSGLLQGAGHNLNKSSDTAVKGLCEKVVGFVHSVDPELAQTDVGKL